MSLGPKMRFAVKKLTRSDLTLFDVQLHKQNAGKQKAINLNRDVFVDVLFPDAPGLAEGLALQFRCDLRILGPRGIRDPRIVVRKVIAAGGTQKNWRLNGETVRAVPEDADPDRYDDLQEDDIAVFGFDGVGTPDAIILVLLSADHPADSGLHAGFLALLGGRSMRSVSEEELSSIAATSVPEHPIRELSDPELDALLEEAAMGSSIASKVLRKRGTRRTSHKAFAEARAAAERIGRDGEVLVRGFLRGEQEAGRIRSFVWEAETDATHPHDFTVIGNDGISKPVEVKSTSGEHARGLMFSHAEIEFAAGAQSLEVWRVSEMRDGRAKLRFAKSLSPIAQRLVKVAGTIEVGVMPNGWTISPEALAPWSAPIDISMDDDPES